jgi:hypothetical protein
MRLSPTGDPVSARAMATTQNALSRTAARPNQKAEPRSIHPTAWPMTELLRAFWSLASISFPLPESNVAQCRSTHVQTAMFASVHKTAPPANATSALPHIATAQIGTPNRYASASAYPTARAPLRAPPLESSAPTPRANAIASHRQADRQLRATERSCATACQQGLAARVSGNVP